ncbi:MAG: penicillin-binding transpeptidase domain-containing protein [Defluviitaleaceae bacterium]|nr:penicillin-binding transpeptidase domain-containing protein [Defluviitaleaceae bacterium]
MIDFKEKIGVIARFFTDRLFLMSVAFVLVFVMLVGTLFDLQIVRGHVPVHQEQTWPRAMQINAPRGEIFDAHGRPLAINFPVFTVMLDPSVEQTDPCAAFRFFIEIMHLHGEEINIDSEFLITEATPRRFTASEPTQRRWMRDLGVNAEIIDAGIDAEAAYVILMELFDIPESMNPQDAHTLLVMRTAHYLQRFNLHQIPLATGIEAQTVAALEEHNRRMPGIYVAFDYLRYYPMGKYTTNIVGYITRIREGDLIANQHLGYAPTDLFGIAGIERAFEYYLRGQRGEVTFEVDSSFRRVRVTEETPPVPGDNIHLTIDAILQRNIYYILEDNLSTILRNRLMANPTSFGREMLDSMVRYGRIDAAAIMEADESQPAQYIIGNFVRNNIDEDNEQIAIFIGENILSGHLTMLTVINVMAEQGLITIDEYYAGRLASGRITPAAFLATRIDAREITPQMVSIPLHPSTGSVVVTDVRTGAVLAAVNYPTFDANNLLGHTFDIDYFRQINNDPTKPQFNRAFEEADAPGSTFKMITALAALDQGIINTTDRILDGIVFRDAGTPYLRSWSSSSFGRINVADAIAVSSNYFFARVAFEMGNHRDGRMIEGIETLNHYMMAVGLGSPTGVEIWERPAVTAGVSGVPRIASPAYKAALMQGAWVGGDTSNVSIGQGLNNYTSASMAKYMAVLATGGTRYQMHLLGHRESADGQITAFTPVVEYQMNVDPTHMEAVHRGMREVITSSRGTGRGIFAGFPMDIAVKSGTAETGLAISHSTYGGFAPFDDPQIAVYVMMPFGDTPYLRASAGHVLRQVLEEYFGINQNSGSHIQNGGLIR